MSDSSVRRLEEPYPAKAIFDSLTPLTRRWFSSRFEGFSPPQHFSILNIKKRLNTLISSPTGSGKTLSAFLAVLDDLVADASAGRLEDRVYCIYISPLKALGNDIEQNLERPLAELEELHGSPLGIRVATRTGDTTPYARRKMLKVPPHILITTPESFTIMLASEKFRHLMTGADWVVVDEIHALADNKRGTQLASALERLQAETEFTRIGLSATVAPLERVAQFLVGFEEGSPRRCDIVDVQYTKELDVEVQCPVENLITTSHSTMREAQYEHLHKLIQEHRTTLVFTNTRAATERVVHELMDRYPASYAGSEDGPSLIHAHHGSLSKERRLSVEDSLREGALRAVVCSTSLELGIDIGFIDLVVLLGSPKSVARALQRIGRSGHKLHATAKGRIVVLDRDDLVECAVLAREALRGRVDAIDIPQNCLDVLSQEVYALAVSKRRRLPDAYRILTGAFPFRELSYQQFMSVVRYLAGEHAALEERHVYAKIWYDEDSLEFGRRGRLARMIYMTNTGTIPDSTSVLVKAGEAVIGSISEPFLEKLKKGDVFVLGGEAFEFRFSRGMTAQVRPAVGRRPTVPSWFSEMLPLSFDLASAINRFRKDMDQLFSDEASREQVLEYLLSTYPIGSAAAQSIFEYCRQQFLFSALPGKDRIVVEHFRDGHRKHVVFHTLYGRRVNDVLSRAVALIAGRLGAGDSEIQISDNGFALRYRGAMQAKRALLMLAEADLADVMKSALEKTEVLRRRFRHCAARAFMILRRYKGRKKTVGRQHVSSQILINAVKRLGDDFPILAEARREVLEDAMDVRSAQKVLASVASGDLEVLETSTQSPSPFAFSLFAQGFTDVLRMDEKQVFLQRMHQEVLAQIALSKSRAEVEEIVRPEDFSYEEVWEGQREEKQEEDLDLGLLLKQQLYRAAKKEDVPAPFVYAGQRLIEGASGPYEENFVRWLEELLRGSIPEAYGDELVQFFMERLPDLGWK